MCFKTMMYRKKKMITIERHTDADEIWILDSRGATEDLQIIIENDTVFITQHCKQAGMQVLQLTQEQFSNFFVALQLEPGTYHVEDDQVKKVVVQ